MTAQLVQARRIASLRERRSERERRDAALCVREHSAEFEVAATRLHQQVSQRHQAEQMLIADPADPQALLWRMLSREQEQGAAHAAFEAEQSLVIARGNARSAQAAHDRNLQRGQVLDQRIAAQAAVHARRAEDRDADDLPGRSA